MQDVSKWIDILTIYSLYQRYTSPEVTLPVSQHDIYKALTAVVKQCNNFKVKINAATALSVPQTRRCYGDVTEMTSIWDSLVGALRTAESITDFGEFRYREHLVEQVRIDVCWIDTRNYSRIIKFPVNFFSTPAPSLCASQANRVHTGLSVMLLAKISEQHL